MQRALRQLVHDETAPRYERPPGASEQLAEAAARLATEAREEYASGYEAALKRLPEFSWQDLDAWAKDRFSGFLDPQWLNDGDYVVPAWANDVFRSVIAIGTTSKGDVVEIPRWDRSLAPSCVVM